MPFKSLFSKIFLLQTFLSTLLGLATYLDDASAADFPMATEDLVGSYRYLEARSQDFLTKFDKAEDPSRIGNETESLSRDLIHGSRDQLPNCP